MVHKPNGEIAEMNASDFREILRWAMADSRCDMYMRNQINRVMKVVAKC